MFHLWYIQDSCTINIGQIESFHGSDKRIYQEIQIALHMFQEAVSCISGYFILKVQFQKP